MTQRDILTDIDRAIDGLCPCGAQPRPGSPYCSPDCEPTHIGPHTGHNAMRWRPDMLIAEPDDPNLAPVDAPTHYVGPFNARLLQPRDRDELHLRLDDGHRWVGVVLDQFGGDFTPDWVDRLRRAWRRLERELNDPARAEAPDAVRLLNRANERIARMLTWERRCRSCGLYGAPVTAERAAGRLVADPTNPGLLGAADPIDIGPCQVCPHCHAPHPGPPLTMITRQSTNPAGWEFRLTATQNGRRYGMHIVVLEDRLLNASDPVSHLRHQWDRMEAQVLAQAPPSPPSPVRGRMWVGPIDASPADRPAAFREVGVATDDGLRNEVVVIPPISGSIGGLTDIPIHIDPAVPPGAAIVVQDPHEPRHITAIRASGRPMAIVLTDEQVEQLRDHYRAMNERAGRLLNQWNRLYGWMPR